MLRLLTALGLMLLAVSACLAGDSAVSVTVVRAGESFIIDALIDAPVRPAIAWEVLTDFDHMAGFLGNLTSSRITGRQGNELLVRQKGVARYGLLSFTFESEREIRLEPQARILSRNLSGTVRSMESEARLQATANGTQIRYHAEMALDSTLARLFGKAFVQHETEEQFTLMVTEMKRREAAR